MSHHDFSRLLKPSHRNPLIADKGRSFTGVFANPKIVGFKNNDDDSDIQILGRNEEVVVSIFSLKLQPLDRF